MGFDPFNLLLLAIAAIVFWRLRSVLGTRTGNERPPFDPFGANRQKETPAAGEAANGNVLRFPKEDDDKTPAPANTDAEPVPVWTGFAEAGSAVAVGLEKIAKSDPAFTPKSFIDGAKQAYEMIVDAFARGDKAMLKNLLSRDVYDGFAGVIDQREAAGQKVESRFVGIDQTSIVGADLNGRKASLTVRFVSELISATLARDGSIVEGDPKHIQEITDVWTFERDTASRDPNWKLVATEEPV